MSILSPPCPNKSSIKVTFTHHKLVLQAKIMHLYVIAEVFRIKNVGIYDPRIANSGERGRKSARNVSPRRIRYILLRGDMGLVGK